MTKLTELEIQKIQDQIDNQRKQVSYNMRELTIEIYVNKYLDGLDNDENELYVPEYQREFVWDVKHQSRFIESLILGLPVPFFFAAEIKDTGRLEIVDGSQRIRTMAAFLTNKFKLCGLEKLTELNGKTFEQLPASRQRMFKNMPLRMVVLSADASEDTRKEMFDRINTSSVALLSMETRRGIYRGKFMDFITELAKDEEFKKLCPLPKYMEKRREEELILRFFAFGDTFPSFNQVENKGVSKYLDSYLQEKNETVTQQEMETKRNNFYQMVKFVAQTYPEQGFAKKKNVIGISRPYFEAIAIGAYLALTENPLIKTVAPVELVVDKKQRNAFIETVDGRYSTHTAKKIKARIEIAKQAFLNHVG